MIQTTPSILPETDQEDDMPQPTEWQLNEVRQGMYHLPTEENRAAGRYCSGCKQGRVVGKPVVHGFEPRVRCKLNVESRRKLGMHSSKVIEPGAVGCKYWEERR